ncbi:MAG: hypothetical protein HC921_00190 [Synechococcaceae cyanobacterium SM2_3_1]|nr:hypothetical protein [Synechococcaceae cyanobacterium SM2_3_1]
MTTPILVILPGEAWAPPAVAANRQAREWIQRSLDPSCLWVPPEIGVWNSWAVHSWLQPQIVPTASLLILAFSAGVVGALGLTQLWSGSVVALIAVDGWCVPLWLSCPVIRLSHDLETHANGLFWGGGIAQFYADPFVSHTQLWGDPDSVLGWSWIAGRYQRSTALTVLQQQVQAYTHLPRSG